MRNKETACSYALTLAFVAGKIVNLYIVQIHRDLGCKLGEAKRSLNNNQLSASGSAAGMTKSKHIPRAAKNRGGLSAARRHVRCGNGCEIHET